MSEVEVIEAEEIEIPEEELEDDRTPLEKLKDAVESTYAIVQKIRKGGEGEAEKAWNIYITALKKLYGYIDEADALRKIKEKELAPQVTKKLK